MQNMKKLTSNIFMSYYENNKERLQTKSCEIYQSLFKELKRKKDNMIMNNTKIYQMKKKNLLSIEKNIIK